MIALRSLIWYGCVVCSQQYVAGAFGSFLLAIYDADAEEYQTISKIGTGFSEEQIKEMSEQLKDLVIPKAPRYYRCARSTCMISLTESSMFSPCVENIAPDPFCCCGMCLKPECIPMARSVQLQR
jgi:ATP dependent DNA ligase C terminal region